MKTISPWFWTAELLTGIRKAISQPETRRETQLAFGNNANNSVKNLAKN